MKEFLDLPLKCLAMKGRRIGEPLEEALDVGKTFIFFLPNDEKISTYLQVERNDHKWRTGARAVGVCC